MSGLPSAVAGFPCSANGFCVLSEDEVMADGAESVVGTGVLFAA